MGSFRTSIPRGRALRRTAAWLGAPIALLALTAPRAAAQAPADFFKQNCTSCHTVGGGRLVGPDLKGVTERRDHAWLERFMPNPKAMIDSGDATAASLVQAANGIVMPTLPALTPARVKELIAWLGGPDASTGAAAPIELPFTAQDVVAGRAIFEGTTRLKGGGPPCASCHAVGSLPALGGGRLGPDLTLALERLGGRRGVTAWLGAPATSTMQSVFAPKPLQPEEVHALTAFLDNAARTDQPADSVGQLNFLMLGLGGAVFGLVLADTVWKGRFRAVRRPLVEASSGRGEYK